MAFLQHCCVHVTSRAYHEAHGQTISQSWRGYALRRLTFEVIPGPSLVPSIRKPEVCGSCKTRPTTSRLAQSVSRQELRARIRSGIIDPAAPPLPDEPPPEFGPGRPAEAAPSPVGLRPQSLPGQPPRQPSMTGFAAAIKQAAPVAEEQHLRIRMTVEQYAIWEALREARRKQQPGVTAADLMLENLSGADAAESSGGRSPYLLVILTCPACGGARIPTSRGEADADQALLSAALCDGVIEQPDGQRRQAIMPRLRRLALRQARYTCKADGCRHTRFLEVHHRVRVGGGGRTELANLAVLCSQCHRQLHRHETDLHGRRRTIEALAHDATQSEKAKDRQRREKDSRLSVSKLRDRFANITSSQLR